MQTIRFEGDRYVRMVGIARIADRAEFLPRFRNVIDSVDTASEFNPGVGKAGRDHPRSSARALRVKAAAKPALAPMAGSTPRAIRPTMTAAPRAAAVT